MIDEILLLETFSKSPMVVQVFFVLIFIIHSLGFFIATDFRFNTFNISEARDICLNAPLLCGFGGTISSLFSLSTHTDIAQSKIEVVFLSALGTSIYGVICSLSIEILFTIRRILFQEKLP